MVRQLWVKGSLVCRESTITLTVGVSRLASCAVSRSLGLNPACAAARRNSPRNCLSLRTAVVKTGVEKPLQEEEEPVRLVALTPLLQQAPPLMEANDTGLVASWTRLLAFKGRL